MTRSLIFRIAIVSIASQVTIVALSFVTSGGGPLWQPLIWVPVGPIMAGLLIPRAYKELRYILIGLTLAIGWYLGSEMLGISFVDHYEHGGVGTQGTYNVYICHAVMLLFYATVSYLWYRTSWKRGLSQALPTRKPSKAHVVVDGLSGLGVGLLAVASILTYIIVLFWLDA